MNGKSRGKIPSHNLDILYGVIALLIFIMAVMALSNPDENKVLFLLSFSLPLFYEVLILCKEGRKKEKKNIFNWHCVLLYWCSVLFPASAFGLSPKERNLTWIEKN